jgi:uncharacterized protein (DUF697 family)
VSTELVQRRDYLDDQRRHIVARSIVGSIVGIVPIPFLDDWALEAVLGSGYRRIANAHHVDLDDEAVKNLVHGKSGPLSLVDVTTTRVAYRVAGRAARRMLVLLASINRARAAARQFVVMTLFDHYCAKLHKGLALDGATALLLREDIDRTIDNTPGALAFHPFRKALLGGVRAMVKAPLQLADLASRGGLRRFLSRGKSEVVEPEAVHDVDQAIDSALASKDGFLARTVAAVELQLSSEANPFLEASLDSLDRRWRARTSTK